PLFVRLGRRRRVQLGIDGDVGRAAMQAIDEILAAEGPLTREELAARLASRDIPTEGQAIYHLIGRAALEAILCVGPPREGKATYVHLAGWLPPPAAEAGEGPAIRLARRYVAGYGPVGPEDFAHWSGLPVREARAAFEAITKELLAATFDGETLWLCPSRPRGWRSRRGAGRSAIPCLATTPICWATAAATRSSRRRMPGRSIRAAASSGPPCWSMVLPPASGGWCAGPGGHS